MTPTPRFQAGDRVRSVHRQQQIGTVVCENLSVGTRQVLGGPVRPIDLRPSTYDVRWDDQTYDATNVPEDELESE